MNKESQIIQLKLLDQEVKINDYSDKRSEQLSRAYKRKLSMLKKRITFDSKGDLDTAIAALAKDSAPDVAESFSSAALMSKKAVDNALSWDGLYTEFKPAAMSQNQLKGLALTEKIDGKTLTSHLDTAIGSKVRREVSLARIRGEGINKMTANIEQSLGGAATRREIETISRTYTATASSYAKRLTYEKNANVINGFTWCATLENGNFRTGRGTCPRCGGLDQQEYETLAQAPPWPLHRRCRCIVTPITKSFRDLGIDMDEAEEANRPWTERLKSGKIDDYGTTDESYGEWWMSKPPTWQDSSTVGPTRAEFIRSGLIGYNDIVDRRTGRLLNIKQLKSKFNL